MIEQSPKALGWRRKGVPRSVPLGSGDALRSNHNHELHMVSHHNIIDGPSPGACGPAYCTAAISAFGFRNSFGPRPSVFGFLAVLLFFTLLTCARPAGAQTNFLTILTNGPVSNRLNVVVLSEGYTTTQYTNFLVDATNE